MNKKKFKVKRIIIGLIIMALIIGGLYYVITNFTGKPKDEKVTVVVNEIKAYGYTLDENETKLYKDLFKSLKTNLEGSTIDEELYASLVSQLFIADFYNLDNKTTNGDIGGVQYIHLSAKDNFILKAQDTIYKYVENNVDGSREQILPIVTNIIVDGIYTKAIDYLKQTDDKGYEVKLTLEYKEDLGYPTTATILLVHETSKKLSIVELN